ncbi:MAG: queuosine precursor transporter [Christensenellaceae bacterium]|jgi:coenzyme F420-0:L-glutamate ligase|nr:queuosine precursor transporter [Christensenellaceae bacterium]
MKISKNRFKFLLTPLEVMLALYIFGIIVVNLMGAKTMPLGEIGTWRFDISVAIFLMPLLYSIIDCVSEVYGRKKARSFVFIGLICIILLMAFIFAAIALPAAPKSLPDEPAYERIFGIGWRMALASFVGFFVSELLDIFIYSKLKKATRGEALWLRNNVSNIVGELVDTTIFMFVAFYGLQMGGVTVDFLWLIPRILPYWLAKCVMSAISTPLVYLGVKYLRSNKRELKITGIKTPLVRASQPNLEEFVLENINNLAEEDIVIISSKVVALCEGRVENKAAIKRDDLIKREAALYLERGKTPNMFTITHNTLISASGIDESNADGVFVLWSADPMASAQKIRDILVKKFSLKHLGVIISDSTVQPLRRGSLGIMIGWSGFQAVNDIRGQEDLFGRKFEVSTCAVGSGLAAAANLVMGESTEQMPIAIIQGAKNITFNETGEISKEERKLALVPLDEDLFGVFLKDKPWKPGGQN